MRQDNAALMQGQERWARERRVAAGCGGNPQGDRGVTDSLRNRTGGIGSTPNTMLGVFQTSPRSSQLREGDGTNPTPKRTLGEAKGLLPVTH